jgi:hypothetical protein
MQRDLFMQLVAQEGKVPQWAKDGDAFLARTGLNDEIRKFNYGMIIFASARAYENNRAFERKYEKYDDTVSSDVSPENAGENLKFGDKDLVLGLNKNGSLSRFKANGGKGFGEFSSNSKNFSGQIRDAMIQAEKIRFNLDNVDVTRLNGQINAYGEPINGYTNYELWLIKQNPTYLNKTIFYENGQIVSAPLK